jgi:MoxR-like ATPase
VVDDLVAALLAGGHVVLIGVPGLAKTLLVQTVARALDLTNTRVQFTPDLMPSDITGTELMEEEPGSGKRTFRFAPGPVFGNMVLADEINRAPPKTQAALLQAMQERTVTVASHTYELPNPFFVLATQNPIEQEGTYPLPEAQLDRFLFDIRVGYPDEGEEVAILRATTGRKGEPIVPVFGADEALALQRLVRELPCSDLVLRYAAQLVRATRPGEANVPSLVKQYVRWGAGPRAGQALILGAKAAALLSGRVSVSPADVRRVALPVLRHRILPNFAAEADGISSEPIIDALLAHIAPPSSALPG